MLKQAHEVTKALAQWITAEISNAGWKRNGKPLNIVATGGGEVLLVPPHRSSFMQEPDESYKVEGAEYPFVVIEVRDGQLAKKLRNKIFYWAYYAEAQIKVICFFEIVADPETEYRIMFTVVKVRKQPLPTAKNPNYFGIRSDFVLTQENISSRKNSKSFTISASEVCPDTWKQDPSTKNDPHVTIQLSAIWAQAQDAINEKKEQVTQAAEQKVNPKKFHPNQEEVCTPPSSNSSSSGSSVSGPDDPDDLDYTPGSPWEELREET
ncbi:MAG: hypothetical protein LQ345_000712 [Seirophora villosa]|nr:MAG: hypothetical protein LQ345_004134 [Seirophora villosa]KAI4119377.1 MAG: hypothetical protein LQ345_000712 [Seirophora villosa]